MLLLCCVVFASLTQQTGVELMLHWPDEFTKLLALQQPTYLRPTAPKQEAVVPDIDQAADAADDTVPTGTAQTFM